MPIRHALLDFDGVLCDSLDSCIEEYELLRKTQFSALPEVARDGRMDIPFAGALKTSLHGWLSDTEAAEFFNAHSAAMQRRADELVPFDGIGDFLLNLPSGSASVVSSAYNEAIRSVLAADTGTVPKSVRHIYGRDSRLGKDEKIAEVLKAENLQPSEAVYVGDLVSDLIYCRSVPMQCVLVTYGYNSPAFLRQQAADAYAFVDSVAELRDLLLTLMR